MPTVQIVHPDLPGGLTINADEYDPDSMQLLEGTAEPSDEEVLQTRIAYMEQTKAANGLARSEQMTLTNLKKRLAKIQAPPAAAPAQ